MWAGFSPLPSAPTPAVLTGKGKGSVLDRMRQRLTGGRFRWLNEQMYTSQGADSQRLLQQNPAFFDEYHQGESVGGVGLAMRVPGTALKALHASPCP